MIVTAHATFGTIGGGHLEFEAIRLARDALAHASAAGGVARALSAGRAPRAMLRRRRDARVRRRRRARARRGSTPPPRARAPRRPSRSSRAWAARTTAIRASRRHRRPCDRLARRSPRSIPPPSRSRGRSCGDARAGAVLVNAPAGDDCTLLVHVVPPDDFTVLVFGNGHVGRALVQVLGALPAKVRWIDSRDTDFPAAIPANVGDRRDRRAGRRDRRRAGAARSSS